MSQMFFPNDYYKSQVLPLWLCQCNICHQQRRDMKNLRIHIQKEHNIEICQLCLVNRNLFPNEYRYYTQKEYEKHLKTGDGDGNIGHPICEFCHKRYYDKTSLFIHLSQDHFSCHICTKNGMYILYVYMYVCILCVCMYIITSYDTFVYSTFQHMCVIFRVDMSIFSYYIYMCIFSYYSILLYYIYNYPYI